MGGSALESPLRIEPLPGLKLIETLLWDGATYPRLPLHLARLARSATTFGFACDPQAVTALLPRPEGAARVRLTLDASGPEVTLAPLPAAAPHWRLALAAERLSSADPFLRHKTTHRRLYDTARANLPPGMDEVIFANERGEVCEGTITNIFFDRGQGLRTPPLTSGLLPGVLRAELACPEEPLLLADLPQVRLWVGNALRGLIPAQFLPQANS
ncbi:MAG: aminotransferase class IV family protein [Gemmobacter sp.]|uniref:aminotransferase class IV family protein n=1 Tax=Gemmobacter sp. TaxID=1898957 RepID=UPI001A55CF1F|nr:aminotransferase class IV family protein [Gemmobacter sp.]MBL8561338.1 aminotransferase class IV family protein [Gemmobacter sp.]